MSSNKVVTLEVYGAPFYYSQVCDITKSRLIIGPRQANLVLIAYPRSLARTSAARSYKQWVKRNLQTENQIPGPSELLGMRS